MLQAASCADSHVLARVMMLKWCPGGSGSKSASIPARLLSLRLDKNFAVGSLSFSPNRLVRRRNAPRLRTYHRVSDGGRSSGVLTYELRDNDMTRAVWPHAFRATLRAEPSAIG